MMNELQLYFYCIGIDLPGHGNSPPMPHLTFNTILKALVDILSTSTSSKISIIGYSMGGRLAMLLDYHYSHLLHHIIILSAHPGLSRHEKKNRRTQERYFVSLLKRDPSSFLREWYSQPLFKTLCLEDMLKKRRDFNNMGVANTLQALSITRQPSLWHHLHVTPTPFVFVYGENDEHYKALYERLPSFVQKKEIPLASHAVHIENPSMCVNICMHTLLKKNPCIPPL